MSSLEYYTYVRAVRILIVIGLYVIAYFGIIIWLYLTRKKDYKSQKVKK